MADSIKAPKKLIEVALPLDAINKAAAREKSIRHGHPSTLHLWWARRPLAAARAVLFAQLVNDPGGERGWGKTRGQTREQAERERKKLFDLIEELVQWENTNNEDVLARAREAIQASWRETCALDMNRGKPGFDPETLPPFHDPFAGGGTLPLEAQRLGLAAHASDLNPVAVLINKAMIEIPPTFAGRAPVGPEMTGEKQTSAAATDRWVGAGGLAEDVRRYGAWIREEAFRRIGHLYPRVTVSREMAADRPDLAAYAGKELTVIAWLWARTVASPNPALGGAHVPLVASFWLSKKPKKRAWVEPVVSPDRRTYRFTIRTGGAEDSPDREETVNRTGATCLLSGTAIPFRHVRSEGKQGRLGSRLLAIVAEGSGGRIYLEPTEDMESLARSAVVSWAPVAELPDKALGFRVQEYGMQRFADLFTSRQLVALNTFCELVGEARARAIQDARNAGWPDDGKGLAAGGTGAVAYGDAVAVYLAFAVDKLSESHSTFCTWSAATKNELVVSTFRRHALPMVWDFAEANAFAMSSGSIRKVIQQVANVLESMPIVHGQSVSTQADAQSDMASIAGELISTDPPYYDNIGYADLSDFFYVWLRRSLQPILPDLFATLLVPKAEELVATPFRHDGKKDAAEAFFLEGMTQAMRNMAAASHPAFPVTIYYAFKQSDSKGGGTASTGWETFLEAVLRAGLAITGTWPMHTERSGRTRDVASNALASSIVLVCRKRPADAALIARREFLRLLESELPVALEIMTGGSEGVSPIAPVDLAQAAIGPGMALFSRHSQVLEADGQAMSVRSALLHINKAIDEYFADVEGEMDADTRFCVAWFQQRGFEEGLFGEADVLSRAKGTSVEGIVRAGVARAGGGKVKLLDVGEYPAGWDPATDERTPVWEACHQLCRALQDSESAAGALLARIPARQEPIRQLAYRLYTLCERKGAAREARYYNELVTSWQAIVEEGRQAGMRGEQTTLRLG